MITETAEHRLKRLKMRSWRRGTKEMDLILGPFSDKALADLTQTELDCYEVLLEENDIDLYLWISGRTAGPENLTTMIDKIRTAIALG